METPATNQEVQNQVELQQIRQGARRARNELLEFEKSEESVAGKTAKLLGRDEASTPTQTGARGILKAARTRGGDTTLGARQEQELLSLAGGQDAKSAEQPVTHQEERADAQRVLSMAWQRGRQKRPATFSGEVKRGILGTVAKKNPWILALLFCKRHWFATVVTISFLIMTIVTMLIIISSPCLQLTLAGSVVGFEKFANWFASNVCGI